MGTLERRDREKEELRQKILECARDLFASEGYEKVTMRRIADSIEYSPTTIYHYFPDKEGLVKCLCEEDFRELLQALKTQPVPEDPVEWIRQLGRAYVEFGLNYPNHYRFMFMTPAKPHHETEGENAYLLLRVAVEKAILAQRFRRADPETIAQVLWAGVHGAVALLVTFGPEGFRVGNFVRELPDEVIENNLRGFLAHPEQKP